MWYAKDNVNESDNWGTSVMEKYNFDLQRTKCIDGSQCCKSMFYCPNNSKRRNYHP